MIVRNESRVIERLLDSVRGLVQEYVIVDTGSTDDTVAKIEAHALPGKVIRQPFVNFGVSRTFSMDQARLWSTCAYVLLLDADMVLQWTAPFPSLGDADAYYMLQKSGLSYRNLRVVRRVLSVTCVGATHEYWDLPSDCVVADLPADKVWIQDYGDGGCKGDKCARDLKLLEAELRVDPLHARTVFYYAQTCYDDAQYERAIHFYLQRVALAGWDQEVVYSKCRMALCYMAMGDLKQARAWTDTLLLAEGAARAEPAYYMCKALREAGQPELAYYYCLRGLKLCGDRRPSVSDCLFVEDAVYDYLLDFERSVLWYYLKDHPRSMGLDLCLSLLDREGVPGSMRACVYGNLVFYVPALATAAEGVSVTSLFAHEHWDHDGAQVWRYSSPSFLEDGTVYCRLVNYLLHEDGSYQLLEDRVNTRLLVGDAVVDRVVNKSSWHHPDAPILGLEDTRIVKDARTGTLYTLSATMEYARLPLGISQAVGVLDLSEEAYTHTIHAVMQSPRGQLCEKNWVFVDGVDTVVYQWYPELVVGRLDLEAEAFVETRRLAVPGSFQGMRGSTNGCLCRGQWWFVTHSVVDPAEGEDGGGLRKYLHRVVVLSRDLTSIVNYSRPFTFESPSDIEYCLGFSISDDGRGMASFGYSVRDRGSKLLKIPLDAIP